MSLDPSMYPAWVPMLTAVAANGTSAPVALPQGPKDFAIIITGTATVQIQASVDGKNWFNAGSAITASAVQENGNSGFQASKWWQAVVSGYSSGQVTVNVGYLNPQTP
jgi:hypothetical protein